MAVHSDYCYEKKQGHGGRNRKMSTQCTSMQIQMIQRYINNQERVCFDTFNTHLNVSTHYYPPSRQLSRIKTHTHTMSLQLLYIRMVMWIHVSFNNTACFLIDWVQYITHRCCANAGLICTYITGTIKMRWVSCTLYDCNCTACLSGPFSLLCKMGTQSLLLYLNTLIKQSWMVLRQLQLSCSTV